MESGSVVAIRFPIDTSRTEYADNTKADNNHSNAEMIIRVHDFVAQMVARLREEVAHAKLPEAARKRIDERDAK
jgi:hypothetical protein